MDATDVAIVGLGFTGLPVAVIAAEAGLRVVGIDRSPRRVREIVSGAPGCGLGTVCERALRDVINRKALRVQEASGPPTPARTTVLCVPTPAGESRGADLRPLLAAADAVAPRLRRGDLVLVQSTCPVGTVERVLAPRLGRRVDWRPAWASRWPTRRFEFTLATIRPNCARCRASWRALRRGARGRRRNYCRASPIRLSRSPPRGRPSW